MFYHTPPTLQGDTYDAQKHIESEYSWWLWRSNGVVQTSVAFDVVHRFCCGTGEFVGVSSPLPLTGFNPPRSSSPRGTWRARRKSTRSRCFNPPRSSSPRGTRFAPGVVPRVRGVSIRPGVHHPGEHAVRHGPLAQRVSIRPGVHHHGELHQSTSPARHGLFQSAPEFITPGNAVRLRREDDAIRFQSAPEFITPGNYRSAVAVIRSTGFNPPRSSSPRGTCEGEFLFLPQLSFNPPRSSSPRGTDVCRSS